MIRIERDRLGSLDIELSENKKSTSSSQMLLEEIQYFSISAGF